MSCHSLLSPLVSLDYLDWVTTLNSSDEPRVTQTLSTSEILEENGLTLNSFKRTPNNTNLNVSLAKIAHVDNSNLSYNQPSLSQDTRQFNSQSSISSLHSTYLPVPLLKFCSCPIPSLEVCVCRFQYLYLELLTLYLNLILIILLTLVRLLNLKFFAARRS